MHETLNTLFEQNIFRLHIAEHTNEEEKKNTHDFTMLIGRCRVPICTSRHNLITMKWGGNEMADKCARFLYFI